jgi:peroxiredoxin
VTRQVTILAIVALLAGVIYWQNREQKPAAKAKPLTANTAAPEFNLTDINGQPVDSSKYRGKVVLVDFWATWCVPCEAEIPHLVEWQANHGGDGLQVVGFSMDDTAGPVKKYVEQHKMQYPIAMADDKTIAQFGGVLGLPANFIIGRDGKLIARHVGVSDINVLKKEVETALAH